MPRRLNRMTVVGFGVVAVSALIYWWVAKDFDAYRGDFFYLADAFLHGRTWLDFAPGPNDVIIGGGDRFYVPFAPFPAIALMPLVAITGPVTADEIESGVNAVLAASTVGMGWWLLGRIGVQRAVGSRVAGRAARLLDPDPVDHDARRRVAHRAPDRDAAHARLPDRAVGKAPGVAHRAPRRGCVPDPCAARLRGPVLCAACSSRSPRGRSPICAASSAARGRQSPGAHGSGWRPASCRRSRSSSCTTSSASTIRSSRAMRWRRCRRGSRRSESRACSRSATSR